MLLAISIFSLTIVGNITGPNATLVDEIFSILSAVCILAAAAVADSAMDEAEFSFADRVGLLGHGYLLFCVVAGVMTIAIPLLYIAKASPGVIPGWNYIIFAATGLFVAIKLMQNKEKAWTALMFAGVVASLCVVIAR
jgi:hypothetical protein